MRLSELVKASGVDVLSLHSGDGRISSVTADSRKVGPGSCFLAFRGTASDGHAYIQQAASAGASAIVCEDPAAVPDGVAWARVPDSRAAAGPVAQAFHRWPARALTLIGVTGTKGKTTFTYIARHILEAVGRPTGMIGTIGYELGRRSVPAWNTTPGPVELAELMAEMVDAGLGAAVMEVSSHALDQGRTEGLAFDAAAFTNLTGDHLDYHHTGEAYLAAKTKLFSSLAPTAAAVLNRDDDASEQIAASTAAEVMWYGIDRDADVHARIDGIDAKGSTLRLTCPGGAFDAHTGLIGRHNVANCLAAVGACVAVGVGEREAVEALAGPISVPGRFQRVPCDAGFEVLVDYAHTDDALDNALSALRPLTAGRLIVVFGCGGDRDRTKRPRMAQAAQRWADRIVLTQDNPRTERPEQIIDDVTAGFDDGGRAKLEVISDRREAIFAAIGSAGDGDVVVLAGKGHEDYQIIGTTKHHFDDVEVALAVLARREGRR